MHFGLGRSLSKCRENDLGFCEERLRVCAKGGLFEDLVAPGMEVAASSFKTLLALFGRLPQED